MNSSLGIGVAAIDPTDPTVSLSDRGMGSGVGRVFLASRAGEAGEEWGELWLLWVPRRLSSPLAAVPSSSRAELISSFHCWARFSPRLEIVL